MSSELFYRSVKGKSCKDFVHPRNASCMEGIHEIFVRSFKGSGKFSLALYSLQLLIKGKNLTRHHVISVVEPMIRMSLFGSCYSVLFSATNCLQCKLFGEFLYFPTTFFPGFAAGATIFLIQKATRHFIISAFVGGALETFLNTHTPLKTGSSQCYLKTQTFLFMAINGAFLYLMKLWKTTKTDKVLPAIWFYSPAAASPTKKPMDDGYTPRSNHPCNHLHSCFRSILKETSNYFWFGTILKVLKITMSNFRTIIRHPKTINRFFFEKSTLQLATFTSLYVFLFKATNCLLCRISGKDDAINALVSGFVSGLSYYTHPNLSLAVTAFTSLIHITWKYFNLNKFFGEEFPITEGVFMFTCGFLLHHRMMFPETTSKFIINLVSMATSGRTEEMYQAFKNSIPIQ